MGGWVGGWVVLMANSAIFDMFLSYNYYYSHSPVQYNYSHGITIKAALLNLNPISSIVNSFDMPSNNS